MNARELLAAIPLANRPHYAAQLGITLDAKGEPSRAWTEADLAAAADVCDGAEWDKLEKELQALCEQELNRLGIPFIHLSPKAREKIGWPDLVFPHPLDGKTCAVELKRKGEHPTPKQERMLAKFRRLTDRVAVCRSFEWFKWCLGNTEWGGEGGVRKERA